MNPDKPSREQIEARITALLLGELPADEAELLRWTISQDAELQKLHSRLLLTVGFVREAVAHPADATKKSEPLKLSDERREKLLAHFKTLRPQPLVPPLTPESFWSKQVKMPSLITVLVCVALIALLAAMFLPALASAKRKAQNISALSMARQNEDQNQMRVEENSLASTLAHHQPVGVTQLPKGSMPPPPSSATAPPQPPAPIVLPKEEPPAAGGPVYAQTVEGYASASTPPANSSFNMAISTGTAQPTPSANPQPIAPTATSLDSFATGNTGGGGFGGGGGGGGETYVVKSGDTLTKIAKRHGTTVQALEAANNLSTTKILVGEKMIMPGEAEASASAQPIQAPALAAAAPNGNAASTRHGFILLGPISNLDQVQETPATPATTPGSAPAIAFDDSGENRSVGLNAPKNLGEESQRLAPAHGFSGGSLLGPVPNDQAGVAGTWGLQSQTSPATIEIDRDKVPILADVPVTGQLFRGREANKASRVPNPVGAFPEIASTNYLEALEPNSMPAALPASAGTFTFSAGNEPANSGNGTPALNGSNIYLGVTTVSGGIAAPVVTVNNGMLAATDGTFYNGVTRDDANGLRFFLQTNAVALADSDTETTDVNQALSRYGELTGRTVLAAGLPPSSQVSLPKKSPESKEEEIKDIQLALAKNNVAVVNVGDKFVKALPVGQAPAAGAALEQADLPAAKQSLPPPIPQPEILTRENAFSTFSLNVSDVSFKLAEASLEKGQLPDAASIRSEEFINAFDYRDPEAAPGQPLAFASERARYPFAHNRDLLRFSVKTAAVGRQEGRALNLVLLLDTSGSMERADRVAIIREALRVLASELQPADTVSVVTFARTARLWADGVPGDKAGETLEKVGGITPEGGTNLEEAMRLAYETAHRHYLAQGVNRVVLLTDGAANLGNVNPNVLKQKVEAQRRQGIALDCFGIGWEDYDDNMLEELSGNGDGRYAFINSPEEAGTEFAGKLAGALQVAAQDVKVQVEFNPQRVISWRQIGYAKHQLTKEQFRDNSVIAAEIAAQEAGNALYTVETKPDGIGPIATVYVRYRVPGTQEVNERSWLVNYDGTAPALENSGPAMRLATTAAAFSEWLAASPYAQDVTPDELLKDLSGVPQIYGADQRPAKLETMIREAKSIAGK